MIINNAVLTGSFTVNGVNYITNTPTTGSNTYVGTQTTSGSAIITGSLQVTGSVSTTGTITAQTLVVQTVTSSIVYSSGSNIFGNQLTNVQQMTGSLRVTGSGNHYIQGGNVGIGTITPARKLTVVGTIAAILSDANDVQAALSATATAVNLAATYGSTGTYLPLTFSTNSDERMRITSAGNVGIGTSSPDTLFQAAATGAAGISIRTNTSGDSFYRIYLDSTNYAHWYADRTNSKVTIGSVASVPLTFDTGGTEKMRISSAGNVGIGNISPQARLDLGAAYGGSGQSLFIYNDDNASALAGTKVGFYIDRFSESNSVTFVFPQAGGTTSRYHVAYKATSGTTITDVCYVTYNSTSWTFPSDERMKNVEGIIPNALDKIKDLRAVYYTQKRDPEQKRKVGLLAQDLVKVLPEVVDVPDTELDDEGNQRYMSVALGDTIPLLVKAIQELKAENDALKIRLTALENK